MKAAEAITYLLGEVADLKARVEELELNALDFDVVVGDTVVLPPKGVTPPQSPQANTTIELPEDDADLEGLDQDERTAALAARARLRNDTGSAPEPERPEGARATSVEGDEGVTVQL